MEANTVDGSSRPKTEGGEIDGNGEDVKRAIRRVEPGCYRIECHVGGERLAVEDAELVALAWVWRSGRFGA